MRYLFYRGIMAGRLTANVFLFTTVSIGAAVSSEPVRRNHVTFGRISLNANNESRESLTSSTVRNLLDTSHWLAQQDAATIRIDGVEVPVEERGGREDIPVVDKTTLVASVRTRRKPSFREKQESEEDIKDELTAGEKIDPAVLKAVTEPFVPKSIWCRLRGSEFDHPGVIDDLVETGLSMTKHEDSEWISWKSHSSNGEEASNDTDILVHVGRCRKEDADQYYGANLPMVRTQAIIHMKPKDMADLLLDSSKVHVYNKLSVGREDIREVKCEKGFAKVVKNLTQPPITSKIIESVTLMHCRQLNDDGAYLVVSRAVASPTAADGDEEQSSQQHGKTEILLGVNLLEPCEQTGGAKMTSITHVYSSAIPSIVAARIGVNSAINFVKDIRSICDQPAASGKP